MEESAYGEKLQQALSAGQLMPVMACAVRMSEPKPAMWKTWWFNLGMLFAYSAASCLLAALITPPEHPMMLYVYGGAVAYGCGNVHFVLWFTFYTRERNEAQHRKGASASDELDL